MFVVYSCSNELCVMGIKIISNSKGTGKKSHRADTNATFEKEAFLKFFQNDLNPRTKEEIKKNRSTAYNVSL